MARKFQQTCSITIYAMGLSKMKKGLLSLLLLIVMMPQAAQAQSGFVNNLFGARFSDSDYIGRWYSEGSLTEEGGALSVKACFTFENFENGTQNYKGILSISSLIHRDEEPRDVRFVMSSNISGLGKWVIKDGYIIENGTSVNFTDDDIKFEILGNYVLSLSEKPEFDKQVEVYKKELRDKFEKDFRAEMMRTSKDKVVAYDKNKIVVESTTDDGKKEIETYYRSITDDGKCR